jgi:hypothetical protein
VYPDERLQQPGKWNKRGVNSGQRHARERDNKSIIQATTQAPTHKFNRLQAARGEEDIQGVSGGKVNILGGGSLDYSE